MSFQYDSMPEGGSGGASKSGCPDYWNCVICCTAGRCTKYSSQKKPFGDQQSQSRECPTTGAGCTNPRCSDNNCELDRNPFGSSTQKALHRLESEARQMEMERLFERPMFFGVDKDRTIAHLAAAVDRLTQGHEPANKPLLVLTTLINNQTFIFMDIQLTLGATPKDGVFALLDTVTGGILTGVTFTGQTVGANSNPAAATFAIDPADTTGNSVLPTPLAAGSGTCVFGATASYTDSKGNTQTNVPFTVVKNFTVILGADGVTLDIIF